MLPFLLALVMTCVPSHALQPGVADYIKGTYLGHAAEYPDPNEPLEVIRTFDREQNKANSIEIFSALVSKYPKSRHAHLGLANSYYTRYKLTKKREDVRAAVTELIIASQIGYSFCQTHYMNGIQHLSLEAQSPQLATEWFDQILRDDPDNFKVNEAYSHLYAALGNPEAERYFRKSMQVRPQGNFNPQAEFAEYLIDRGRYEEALRDTQVPPQERAFYLDFLHGYCLEKLGRGEEARGLYRNYLRMSRDFPVKAKYRIPESTYQQGIRFEDT